MINAVPNTEHCDESQEANSITKLIASALNGSVPAWNLLHSRYQPLIINICNRCRVSGADAEDISQVVWLRLYEHLGSLREPRALPGWIATTTKNEILKLIKLSARTQPADPQSDGRFHRVDQVDHAERLVGRERQIAVHEALQELGVDTRQLMLMLYAESHISYQEISDRLGMPLGSIGPTRARALNKLRGTTSIQALVAA